MLRRSPDAAREKCHNWGGKKRNKIGICIDIICSKKKYVCTAACFKLAFSNVKLIHSSKTVLPHSTPCLQLRVIHKLFTTLDSCYWQMCLKRAWSVYQASTCIWFVQAKNFSPAVDCQLIYNIYIYLYLSPRNAAIICNISDCLLLISQNTKWTAAQLNVVEV